MSPTRWKLVTILSLLFAVCSGEQAQANPLAGNTYLKLDAGGELMQNARIQNLGLDLKFAAGYRVDLAGGYRLTDWLAAELETGVSCNMLDQIGFMGISSSVTSLYQIPLLANLVCTVPLHCRLKPYIGGGIGPIFGFLDGPLGSDNDVTFGYQGFAGMNWELNDRWAIGVVYKFLGTSDHGLAVGSTPVLEMGETFSHSFSASIALKF